MNASDIIKQDLMRGGFTDDERKFFDGLASLIQSKQATLIRHGNTVALIFRRGDDVAEFHFYTVDKLPEIETAIRVFYSKMRETGIKKLVSTTDNPKLLQIAKKLEIPVTANKVGNEYHIEVSVR